MELLTAEAIVERIQTAHAKEAGGVLAFDGDGTLWSGDVGEDFFQAVVATGRFEPASIASMCAVGRAAGLPGMDDAEHGTGVAIARALFAGYLEHTVAEDVICEVIASMCAGWSQDAVESLASAVAAKVGPRRHTELRPVIDWARANAVEVFLVSASPRPIVEASGAPWGFDPDHVLAATTPFRDGVMVADVERPIPYGPGKIHHLRSRIGDRPILAAFGDNVFDVPMLEEARVAVAVAPKQRLLARLEQMPNLQPVLLRMRSS